MLEELFALSLYFLELRTKPYHRYFTYLEGFVHRFSILLGQRGVGKTTVLIQHLLKHAAGDIHSKKILYVQTDHFLVGPLSLYEIAEQFVMSGGEVIAFDEIHKYSDWSKELKSIYDTFSNLKILASGSSALEIHKGTHDLSRRAIVYTMYGLSFREYLALTEGIEIPNYPLTELLDHHSEISHQIIKKLEEQKLKVLPKFKQFLRSGYYPYCLDVPEESLYWITLEQSIHTTLESDLVSIYPSFGGNTTKKLKQLLVHIAQMVPFVPKWEKLKEILDIGDHRTLKNYFKYLEDGGIIRNIKKSTQKLDRLRVTDKVYLSNPNLLFAVSTKSPNIGTLRETFFVTALQPNYITEVAIHGDFRVDQQYDFEVGGRNKDFSQLKNSTNGYLACDDIETGAGKKIPLWLFGFLY